MITVILNKTIISYKFDCPSELRPLINQSAFFNWFAELNWMSSVWIQAINEVRRQDWLILRPAILKFDGWIGWFVEFGLIN